MVGTLNSSREVQRPHLITGCTIAAIGDPGIRGHGRERPGAWLATVRAGCCGETMENQGGGWIVKMVHETMMVMRVVRT